MRHSLILSSILAIGCSPPRPPANTAEDATPPATNRIDLNGLIGEWQDVQDSGRTVFNENWSRRPDGSLQGLGFVISGNDTVLIEHLAILDIDSATHYAVTIRSQNNGQAVLFKLIHDRDSLVFAAPAHDFPQRIKYAPEGRERWNVTVTGVQKGHDRVEHFHFQRRKAGSP